MTTAPSSLSLRFQFQDEEHQQQVATLGMWFFLATEILMFGTLFTAYTIYRMYYPHEFASGSNFMEVVAGTVNTAVLLTSSLTMALAVFSAHTGRVRPTVLFLGLTMLLGAVFLGIKAYEYHHHWVDVKVPGLNFRYEGTNAPRVELFFVFYFVMTGLHAVHMVVGLGVLSVLTFRAMLGTFTAEYYTPVELTGLYWHFVDIVWVFLFPLFYLVGRHVHG